MKLDQLTRYLSTGTTESSRRLIAYRSAMVLLIIACALTAVVCFQGMNFKPIDNGLLTALASIVLIVAGLAREIYRKPDQPQPPKEFHAQATQEATHDQTQEGEVP